MKTKIDSASAVNSMSEVFDPAEVWASMAFTRKLIPDEEGGFTAEILELPGCIAEGESADEALQNLESAGIAWIESRHNQGQPIPSPIERYGYSGKVALRIPRGLHKMAAELAAIEGVSLNSFLTTAVALIAGQQSLLEEVRRELKCVRSDQFIFHINTPENQQLITTSQRGRKPLLLNEPAPFQFFSTNINDHQPAQVTHDD